jgi:hypothetical protein
VRLQRARTRGFVGQDPLAKNLVNGASQPRTEPGGSSQPERAREAPLGPFHCKDFLQLLVARV